MLGARRELRVVGDEQHGEAAVAPGVEDRLHDLLGAGGVELAGHLVGEQQVGLVGERHRHRDPLRLATRQPAGQVVEAVARARARRAASLARVAPGRRRPPSSIASSTFSAAVRKGIRLPLCSTIPIRRARSRARSVSSSAVMSCPSKTISPDSGSIRPAISPSSVVLPLPDAPIRLVVSPRASSRLASAEHRRLDARRRGTSWRPRRPARAGGGVPRRGQSVRLAAGGLPKTSGARCWACSSSFSASSLSSASPVGLSCVRLMSSSISCSPPDAWGSVLMPPDAGREVLVLAALLDDEHVLVALERNALRLPGLGDLRRDAFDARARCPRSTGACRSVDWPS